MKTRAKTIDGVWNFYYYNTNISHAQLISALNAVSVFMLSKIEHSEALENCVTNIGRKASNTVIKRCLYAIRKENDFIYSSWQRDFYASPWFITANFTLKKAIPYLDDGQKINKISAAEAQIVSVFKQALEAMDISPK